jgi:hypothetical protein
MSRRRGLTLLEVLGSVALLGAVVAATTPVLVAVEGDRRLGAALADDAVRLRAAAADLELDLRAAQRVEAESGALRTESPDGGASWALEDGVLRRRGDDGVREVLRRVAAFEAAERVGGIVRYEIVLAARTAGAERRAEVSGAVLPRLREAAR